MPKSCVHISRALAARTAEGKCEFWGPGGQRFLDLRENPFERHRVLLLQRLMQLR